jgi:hypothetical protein
VGEDDHINLTRGNPGALQLIHEPSPRRLDVTKPGLDQHFVLPGVNEQAIEVTTMRIIDRQAVELADLEREAFIAHDEVLSLPPASGSAVNLCAG